MDQAALRRFLLDLVGTAGVPDLTVPSERDWAALDRMAAQHRLQPLLHARHREQDAIPSALRAAWQTAHRFAALEALVQQAELAETCALLERLGFAAIALKGAWLSVHAYPEAAQRPLRDLDLLVRPDEVVAAFHAFLDAGYVQAEPADMRLEDIVRLDKHMPPLVAPRGTRIELHHRLWELDGRLDHASPAQDAQLRQRAIRGPGAIRYLAPQDLLAHLIIHAVYSHRLDCGPLVLSDIDLLIRKEKIDWQRFWSDAAEQGWRDGARLMLELVATYRSGASIDFAPDHGPAVPARLLAAAPDLLLQDLDTRASAGLAAAAIKGGASSLAARVLRRRSAEGQTVTAPPPGKGGLLGWLSSRTARSLRDLVRSDVRRQSRRMAELSQWLDR